MSFFFGGDAQTRTGGGDFADLCLTTWLRRRRVRPWTCQTGSLQKRRLLWGEEEGTCGYGTFAFRRKWNGAGFFRRFGAGDEARTRYLHLGKVALYRMSYTRIYGASGRNRTNDTGIFSPLLYLLSYRGMLSRAYALLRMLKNGDPERTRTVDLQRDRLAC